MLALETMENQENSYSYQLEEDEAEDTLSLCNLSLSDGENNSPQQSPRASFYQEELFEFSNALNHENCPTTAPNILFCGKFIHQNDDDKEEEKRNEYQKRSDYLAMLSHDQSSKNGKESCMFKNRSSSDRIDSYYSSIYSVSNVQTVNITALTSMSAKSKRRMFMFGPVKFMPEMELSAIKQRQGKLGPNTISKVVAGQDVVAVNGGGGGGEAGKSVTRRQWGLLKSLRIRRSRLATMLARSFGCFPVAGFERVGENNQITN